MSAIVFNELLDSNSNLYLKQSEQNIAIEDAKVAVLKTDLKPSFNIGYAAQNYYEGGNLYAVQAGVSIPFLSGTNKAKVKTAKIDKEIADTNIQFKKQEVQSKFLQSKENYQKWKTSWFFYKNEVLPLVKEQKLGALFAYKEGEVDYTGFTQLIKEAIQSEIEAQKALINYLESIFQLQYFNQ